MSHSDAEAKRTKKALKAELKLRKKLGNQETPVAPAPTDAHAKTAGPGDASSATPAERSAAAAERQVRLQRYRVWLALLMALLTGVTLLATIRPWRFLTAGDTTPPKAESQPGEPET